MKKFKIASLLIIITMLLFSSCKKEWYCTCNTTAYGSSSSSLYPFYGTKKDATTYCNAQNYSDSSIQSVCHL